MPVSKPLTIFFKNIDKHDIPLVGGKGANLGEMTQAGFPVPNGFAVTVAAYELFLEENNLFKEIINTLKPIDVNDPHQLNQVSKTIQKKILSGTIPVDVKNDVIKSYKKLSGLFRSALVAARSSATAEDLPGASFAGQQATFLNVKGEANLLNAVRECWASLFTPRAIFYRHENKIDTSKVGISVIVQKMIQSVVSGVMFSIDPVTNDKERMVIEGVWGLGEMIVQGSVVPDRYVVQKDTFAILSKEISDQSIQLIKSGSETKEKEVPVKIRGLQKITDEEIMKLAKISQKLQEHYYFPQDTEWAKEGGNIYIVQTRPITTIKSKPVESSATNTNENTTPFLIGQPASPGIGIGKAVIIKSANEIEKVKQGDVLVAPMTSPDFVPAMKKAVAIVTDEGGATSHAAIVSRELGVPCVVGTREATKKLSTGQIVTVDGMKGMVYLGGTIKKSKDVNATIVKEKTYIGKTATRVYVNLAEPERAAEIAKKNVDGVGLLRAEFMIANIGIHPKEAIKQKKQGEFIDKLTHNLTGFCKEFNPRPVVYRATDFKTNEYRALSGGKAWEPVEPNPLLGFRGAFRYVANPEVFTLELHAILNTRKKYKNLWLMIPFVRSPQELMQVRKIIDAQGLFEDPTFKLWMMVELPINVILLDKFIEVGIDGVSIGSNDLTMLLSGTDRDNSEVAQAFDERNDAVDWALRRTIKICHKYGISSSICGQAPSTYDNLVRKLVSYGVTSISVNPDAINRVRGVVADAERGLVIKNKE